MDGGCHPPKLQHESPYPDPEFVVRFYPLARQGGYSSVVQLAVASACAAAQRRRLAAQTHEFFFFLLFRVPVLSPIWPL